MYLEKLGLWNFKNYSELSLELNPRVNVFVGRNGSGKTNILDSIYFLALTKSAFSASDAHCMRLTENFFTIKGKFVRAGSPVELLVSVQSGLKKVFKENGLEYDKMSDHIGKYPVVLVAPDDTDIVRETSETRRRFFDGLISQLDKVYLEALIRYNQALKNRNALLRMFAESGRADSLALESYDQQLVAPGQYLYRRRQDFLNEYLPFFQKFYSTLVNDSERTVIRYVSGLHEVEFETGLKNARARDLVTQRTNFGVHRDDFDFQLGDGDLKRLGSQGQQKSFVIALKFAQFEILKVYKLFEPILLLDDIFDKLDDFRITRLLELIHHEKGQLFITDARPDRTSELIARTGLPSSVFQVEQGQVRAKELT
jgi:DNA replication and repair protein RecF